MKINVNKKSMLYICIGLTIIIVLTVFKRFSLVDLLFYIDEILAFIIVGVAQFSLFSVMAILSNYMLANVFYVYKTGMGYGLLASTNHIYMYEMCIVLLLFNVILLTWITCSKVLKSEKEIFRLDWDISKRTCNVCAIVAVLLAYIAFPSFEFGITTNRFQSLLPGHFWNHFMIVFLIFASIKIKKNNFIKTCVLVITVWLLFHGERVDLVGFYSFLLIRFCVIRDYHLNMKFFIKFGVVLFLVFTGLIYIGEARVGGTFSFDLNAIASSFLSQGTASDVGYVFNSSIDYFKNYKLFLGETYITYIKGIIPFLDQPMRAGSIIQNLYRTAGGEFILVEPLINFGYIGVFVWTNLFVMVLGMLIKKKTVYKSLVYFFLVATSFRYIWYGLTYIETGLLYLLPVAFLFVCLAGKKPELIIKESL